MIRLVIKVIAVVLVLIAGGAYYLFSNNAHEILSPVGDLMSPKINSKEPLEINFKNQNLLIAWVSTKPEEVLLYSNLGNTEIAKDLLIKNQCASLINGGFYTKDKKHIGLFVSEGKIFSPYQQNKLFNGVLAIDNNSAKIVSARSLQTRFALQSGPLFYLESNPLSLVIDNDQLERRMFVAINTDKEIIFGAIYQKDSAFKGPLLADVPKILQEFSNKTNEQIVSALNLDGGTASAFYSAGTSLGELTPVGSYFCIR